MLNMSKLPLGKKPFEPKTKDLHLKAYINKAAIITAASVPASMDWLSFSCPDGEKPQPDTDALGNDRAGDCVFAGPGHMVNMVRAQTGNSSRVSTDEVIAAYSKYSGYDPVTGANDDGYYVRDMLNIWQRTGLYGTKILAYALVNWKDPEEVAIASWLGCGTIGGYSLPIASQDQQDEAGRQLWYVPTDGWPCGKGPGSWGGHCMWLRGASPKLMTANSWGIDTTWTLDWQAQCCDEMWVALVDSWQLTTGRAPNGFAYGDLLADVKARTS
ncbi:hypothetical protein UFOVP276_185 [uncultured Caudovirales phage]|uniref:Uncharacterized protein n=1 Tax=uncultured Caudovirales phage TaxID=2100421 RepID=A0A6J5LIE1_9CAUD|nr:hypothetical protein UFOVP127_79 [uncultured Caudovirales phage]CAB4135229.1 hypothetical protein UFOVP276_185 [uncultured Caudovirales phage]